MKSVTHSIFKAFLLSVLVVAQMHFAYAQTASILPPAKTTFFDANGNPLTAGTVESFIPATTTHKTTWQDAAETIPNANPLTLDAAGRTLLLGSGSYRQLVKDRLGNVIWDQVTSSTGSGGGGGTASTGDGDVVGTIKPWAGMTAPSQYVFTYGQELSRTTFSALFTAITSTQAVFCNSGSPILNGLGDTANFWIGMTVELSCVAPGFTTVISKTATTVTLALNSNVTTGTNAVFFPWGRGNGSTTFNIPDFRGQVLAGNNNMGGTASANLATTFFGSQTPNATGALGGNQKHSVALFELPLINSTGANAITVNPAGNPAANVPFSLSGNIVNRNLTASGALNVPGSDAGNWTGTATFSGSNTITVASTSTNTGLAVSAIVAAGGSGYINGAQTATLVGGTCTTQPTFTVTVAGNAITAPVLLDGGLCSTSPANPAAITVTGGSGSGGTLTVTYTNAPFSTLQPTKTTNYIIKVTPDTVSTVTVGVTSLGSMTGDIVCGAGLFCTGNNVSVTFPALSLGIDQNILNAQISNYSAIASDCGKTITLGGNAFFTLTVGAAIGFPGVCSIVVTNIDAGRGKTITINGVTFPNNGILWPGQSFILKNEANTWVVINAPGLWTLSADTTWFVDPVNGNNSNDCLATGAGACLTVAGALAQVCGPIDAMSRRPIIQLADDTTHYTTQINACEVKGTAILGGFANTPVIRGNTTTLGNVLITTTSITGFSSVNINTTWRVEGIEFKVLTSGTAIVTDVNSKMYIGKNKFTVCSVCLVFQAINGGFIEFVDDFTINGPANAVIFGNNGGRFVTQPITVTIVGTPAWTASFAFMFDNAIAFLPSITFSGASTGNRCNISTGAGIDTNGAGATYLPGNVSCTGAAIANPGWYN